MRGYPTFAVLICMLVLCGCPQKDTSKVATRPVAAPPAEAEPSEADLAPEPEIEAGKVYAFGKEGAFIKVKGFNASGNPYRWKYSEFDQWVWDNYDQADATDTTKARDYSAGETRRALYVTDRGFVVPNLEAHRFLLNRRIAGEPPAARPGPYTLYASGVLSEDIKAANHKARALLAAEYMPRIPSWLAPDPPNWALILPDKSVVFKGKLGDGWGYFPSMENLHDLDNLKVVHYSADGTFLEQTTPGQLWCELFFDDFESALARHEISRPSVREFGHFLQFLNVGTPDKTGYYYYDGTQITHDEIVLEPDYNSLFEMYGKYIPEMYMHQQKKGR